MKERVLVAGFGSIGRRHARLLAERDNLSVEWCEISDDMLKLAEKEAPAPAKIFRDFSEAVESSPDFLVIATPQNLHCSQALLALDAGIPILCEKPLSDNLRDAARIAERVQESGVPFTVGFQSHFSVGHQRMRNLVRSGALGEIRHFHCRVGSYITLENSRSRYQSKTIGALIQDYSHQPDLAYWILNQIPSELIARGLVTRSVPLWAEPNLLSVDFLYPTELLGTLHLNYLQMPQRHHYEILGDEGWVFFDADVGEIQIGNRIDRRIFKEEVSVERDELYRLEHQAFFDTAAGRRTAESPADQGLVSVAVAEATVRSWQTGQPVSMSDLLNSHPPSALDETDARSNEPDNIDSGTNCVSLQAGGR